jgi:hypothetical protein
VTQPIPRGDPKAGRKLLLMALIAVAPIALSYAVYYLLPSARPGTNYGELLPTRPLPAIRGTLADGRPFALDDLRGRWVMVVAAPSACDATCRKALYATRQARTIQNADADRVVRVWLVTDAGPLPAGLADDQPGLVVARVAPDALAALPAGADAIHLVDPLGNQVLAWPVDPDIKRLAKDLARVLKASRVG